MSRRIHIRMWLFAISFLLLVVACSSSDESGEQQPTMLTVYVYSPEHPLLIRSDVGNVDASADETKITRLQIWIFTNGTHEKVAYLDTDDTSMLNVGEGTAYQLPVSEEFVRNKPDVDVYVMANLPDGEFGNTLVEESTRQQILDAKIPEGFFGLTNYAIPAKGLPMTGSLTAQPVVGEAPVLRVGTTSNIATVRLVRAVSKVRFVFANTVGADPLYIKKITLDESVIPNEEYLIQQTRTLETGWNAASTLWENETGIEVEKVENPTTYIYGGQEASVYEKLINDDVNAGKLTMIDPFYLRESDKKLKGTITYQLGENEKQGRFEMDAAGDFRRNHTWIVYAYHAGGGFLQMNAIYIKDWTNVSASHEVYNW
ncbi:MAG: hypothetical protein IJ552_02630 [Prevotella sp.]|nr:hypothetical protein [Prevotella sp.]